MNIVILGNNNKTLLKLMVLLSSMLAACTTMPVSSEIGFSVLTEPPYGLIAFCQDVRSVCHDALDNTMVQTAGATGGHARSGDEVMNMTVQRKQQKSKVRSKGQSVGSTTHLARQSSILRAAIPVAQLPRVRDVNNAVNNRLVWRSDMDRFGVNERWTMPLAYGQGSYGDCEDYVLEKRRLLLAKGVPAGALAVAVVRSSATGMHAVLVVRTTQGDYVLDSATGWVLPWAQTQYRWLKIQEGEGLLRWRKVAEQNKTPSISRAKTGRQPGQSSKAG